MSETQHHKDTGLSGHQTAAPAGDKVDPVSAGPSGGDTIAGRAVNTGGTLDLSNQGRNVDAPITTDAHGGTDTKSGGLTGETGQPELAAHQGPENQSDTPG